MRYIAHFILRLKLFNQELSPFSMIFPRHLFLTRGGRTSSIAYPIIKRIRPDHPNIPVNPSPKIPVTNAAITRSREIRTIRPGDIDQASPFRDCFTCNHISFARLVFG